MGGYGWSISEVGEDGDGVRLIRGVKMGLEVSVWRLM